MDWWLSPILVLTHVLCFAGGVYAYHAVRVLAVRPINIARPSAAHEQKLKEIAGQLAKKEVKAEAYNHFSRFDKPIEIFEDAPIPNVNKVRESGFAPAK